MSLIYDTSVQMRRYLLVNEQTEEVGTDWEMYPDEAQQANFQLTMKDSPWRWFVWTDGEDA